MTKPLPAQFKTNRRRPSRYSGHMAREICKRIAEGEALTEICLDRRMPARTTVYNWTEDKPEFMNMYIRARRHQALGWTDEIMSIADAKDRDVWIDENGNEHVDHNVIQRSKLRVDARFRMLEKVMPLVFGRQAPIQHTRQAGDITVNLERISNRPINKPDHIPQITVEGLLKEEE